VRALLAMVLLTGSAFGFTAVATHVVVQPLVIPSASMLPTFRPTDRVLVDRLPWHHGTVADREVVAFTVPTGAAGLAPARADWMGWLGRMIDQPDGTVLVKRVVAVGGQRLACRDGRVYRDGIPLPEPYLAPGTVTTCDPVTVPAGKVFVLGDNRVDSADSRVFGPIDQRRITGRVIQRIWPLERRGPVR
jgi:signal peptidase I